MEPTNILILGGYGNTGLPLARLLLENSDARLVLAGRNSAKAAAAEARLNALFPGNRVTSRQMDAADTVSLKNGLEGIDLGVVASGTARYTGEVARAALAAGADYLDVQFSNGKTRILQALQGEIEASGRCFITEAGFHPGLPAALVRYAAGYFDTLEKARVSSVVNLTGTDSPSFETALEFVEEFKDYNNEIFKGGKWEKTGALSTRDMLQVDFSPFYKSYTCAPMMMEEMRALPDLYPTLKDTGFYISDSNPLVNWLVYPVLLAGLQLTRGRATKTLAKYLTFSYKAYKRPPYGVAIKLEAAGQKDGKPLEVSLLLAHEDAYLFTAIPVVALLKQYLDGSARKPGLWLMGHLVEPNRAMHDMLNMGVNARITTTRDLKTAPVAVEARC